MLCITWIPTLDMLVLFFIPYLHSQDIPHDFELKLEVYCHKHHEELSVANTPKKIRKKITDISGSVGRSVGKRLSGLVSGQISSCGCSQVSVRTYSGEWAGSCGCSLVSVRTYTGEWVGKLWLQSCHSVRTNSGEWVDSCVCSLVSVRTYTVEWADRCGCSLVSVRTNSGEWAGKLCLQSGLSKDLYWWVGR